MDQDTFTKLAAELNHLHGSASEVAVIIGAALLLIGGICGLFLARWIFRGGMSRLRISSQKGSSKASIGRQPFYRCEAKIWS